MHRCFISWFFGINSFINGIMGESYHLPCKRSACNNRTEIQQRKDLKSMERRGMGCCRKG